MNDPAPNGSCYDLLSNCLQRRENLEAIFNSMGEGLFTLDMDLRISSFNRAAEEITGYTRGEAIGQKCTEVFRGRVCEEDCVFKQARDSSRGVENFEEVINTKSGHERIVNITISLLRDMQGNVTGLVGVIRDVSELRRLQEEMKSRAGFQNMIGKNHRLQRVFELIKQCAGSDASVLVEGESGTGKELVAHAIHYESARAAGPLVKANCSALAESLLESELFGHVKGAFTGAAYDRAGRFEAADGGTILLDEIGDISPLIQLKLLRVAQEREFERVGSTEPIRVDVRIISATHRPLKQLMAEGKFREDLYYRLRVVSIQLPAVRERRDDIPLLVSHFIERHNEKTGRQIKGCTRDAMAAMLAHDWPGNVREIENAIEHAFVVCQGAEITIFDLPPELRQARVENYGNLRKIVPADPDAEREAIVRALEECNWNRTQAAAKLKMGRTTLWRKMKAYGFA